MSVIMVIQDIRLRFQHRAPRMARTRSSSNTLNAGISFRIIRQNVQSASEFRLEFQDGAGGRFTCDLMMKEVISDRVESGTLNIEYLMLVGRGHSQT